jgi:hypothetical protein
MFETNAIRVRRNGVSFTTENRKLQRLSDQTLHPKHLRVDYN